MPYCRHRVLVNLENRPIKQARTGHLIIGRTAAVSVSVYTPLMVSVSAGQNSFIYGANVLTAFH